MSVGGALLLGACGDEHDSPEPATDPEGDEIVPGEGGPVE